MNGAIDLKRLESAMGAIDLKILNWSHEWMNATSMSCFQDKNSIMVRNFIFILFFNS